MIGELRDAPLVVGIVEPPGVQHAEVALPQRLAVDVVGVQPFGSERHDDAAAVGDRRRRSPGSTSDGASSSGRLRAPRVPRAPCRVRVSSATSFQVCFDTSFAGSTSPYRPVRMPAAGSLLTAVDTKTRSPHTIGLETATPATGVFQRTFSPVAAFQVTAVGAPSATPDAAGPAERRPVLRRRDRAGRHQPTEHHARASHHLLVLRLRAGRLQQRHHVVLLRRGSRPRARSTAGRPGYHPWRAAGARLRGAPACDPSPDVIAHVSGVAL